MFLATVRNLVAHKFRLFATSLSVVLGVAFVTGSLVLTATVGKVFDDLFVNAFGKIDVTVRAPMPVGAIQGQSAPRPLINDSLEGLVRQVDGVQATSPSIIQYAQVLDKGGEPIGNPGQGAPTLGAVWTNDPHFSLFQLTKGTGPRNDAEVVLDRGTARKGGFVPGDRIDVLTNRGRYSFTVSGIAKFGKADNLAGASFVMMTLPVAQQTMAGEGKVDSIDVIANAGISQAELRDRVARAIPSGSEVVTGATLVKENQDQMKTAMKFFNWFLSAFGIIALFVGAFIINNTFSILVAQRKSENALLRMLGAGRGQILLSVLLEALIVGAISAVFGFGVGVAMAHGLRALLHAFGMGIPTTSMVIKPNAVILSVVIGVGVSVLAAVLPALRGARTPPIVALRDAAIETRGYPVTRVAAGAALVIVGGVLLAVGLFGNVSQPIQFVGPAVGMVFIGVAVLGPAFVPMAARTIGGPIARTMGITGLLAQQNTMRNRNRTARTASALVIGVTLVTFISVFGSSMKSSMNQTIDRSFAGDFVVSAPQTFLGGLRPTLVNEIRALPEVDQASSIRASAARVDSKSTYLTAIDPSTFGSIFDVGVKAGTLRDLGDTSIAVSKKVADQKHIAVGDVIPVQFVTNGLQHFRVAAIYDKNTFGEYMVGLPAYEKNVTPAFDTFIMVTKKQSIPAAHARNAIDAVVSTVPTAKLQDQTEFKADFAKQIDQMLNLVYALLGLAVVIALLGIGNTLMLSIVERTHELGLLRAVGMSRRQVKSMTRAESVVIALMGAGQGLVVGLLLGWALQQALAGEGMQVFAVPVPRLVIIAIAAVVAGVLAAAWPARRAARLDVLRAVATT